MRDQLSALQAQLWGTFQKETGKHGYNQEGIPSLTSTGRLPPEGGKALSEEQSQGALLKQ